MKRLFPLLLFLCVSWTLLAQLTIHITETPNNTPSNSALFLAGNINNWEANAQNYLFTQNSDGTYTLVIDPPVGQIEYKITRGSWPSVEGNMTGQYRPNRVYNYTGQTDSLGLSILSWEDLSGGSGNSTATENVTILSEDFNLATIGKKRRIWIYLPPDYEQSSRSYPVLYMHDGQNLFDATTSFSGEWQVDESLNNLFALGDPGVIVVGIDNGGASRIDEYTPWPNPQYGGGQADQYVRSIIQDLKPHIDTNYRTLKDSENTAIMGSSLGGLVSLYALIEYQDVFGKAGIFSPSYWFSAESYTHILNTEKKEQFRIYTIGGEQEGGNMATNIQRMDSIFSVANFNQDEYKTTIHPDGQHTEAYWAREFSAAYLWLFRKNPTTSISSTSSPSSFIIYPNPTKDSFQLKLSELPKQTCLKIVDLSGRVRLKSKVKALNSIFRIDKLQSGMYQVQLYSKNKLLGSERLIIH